LPLGIAADAVGRRKPFILAGIALSGLGAWVMGAADGAGGLLVGRAITGFAASTWVPLIAMFSGMFPPQQAVRASALLAFVGSFGRVIATVGTGWLNEAGGHSLAFYLAAGVAALAVLIMLPAQETARPARRPSVGGIGRLVTRGDVLYPALLATVVQYATWAAPFSFFPILAAQLGGTDVTQSMLVSLHIGLVTVGNLAAATFVDRIGARRMILISFVVLSAGIGVAAIAQSLAWLFVVQFFVGLFQGMSYPVLMGLSIRYVDDADRATAMGLHQAVYAVGMFAGPWLSGLLAEGLGIEPMLGITGVACLAIGLPLVRLLPAPAEGDRAPKP
jgi:MFS family permease